MTSRPRNHLLAALPREAWERLKPHLRHTMLIPGQALQRSDALPERIYFPNAGLVSLMMESRDKSQVEVGVVGREGLVGGLSLIDNHAMPLRAVVQLPGNACWLPVQVLRAEFDHGGFAQQLLLQHFHLIAAQMAQYALCNRVHSVEERLCRWLLMVRDRTGQDAIASTHECIAQMLGTRRSGITIALGELQRQGLIDCARGLIMVLDAANLQHRACECYAALNTQFQHFESVFGNPVENH